MTVNELGDLDGEESVKRWVSVGGGEVCRCLVSVQKVGERAGRRGSVR